MSGGPQLMLQAAVGKGLSFDPLSFRQDVRTPSKVDVGWGDDIPKGDHRFKGE